jgi:hypothetical protein
MAHNSSYAVLGVPQSSVKEVSDHDGDPATYLAGLVVRQKSDGALSLLAADGQWLGVSQGQSLSDHKKCSILRSGLRVPIQLEAQPATGVVTITNFANLVSGTDDSVTVGATIFTAQAGAATLGQTTFQAATGNDETAASLALQINAHATAGALVVATAVAAVVTIKAKLNTVAGDSIALAYTDNDANIGATVSGAFLADGGDAADYVVIGAKVYISNTTGKGDESGSDSTISDAVYVSGVLTGRLEDGSEVACALVDMPGGL